MHSRLLHHFLAVYKHLNISAAAESISISQPALTRGVQLLEAEFGVSLFDRLPTGVVPTRYGEVLAKHATMIFLEYDQAVAEIQAMKGGAAGVLKVGAGPFWLAYVLPSAIAQFRTNHSRIKLKMRGLVINTAVPALLRGDIEIFCGSLDFPDHPEIVKHEIAQIGHVIVAARNHPLATATEWKPDCLLKYPWAMVAEDDVEQQRLSAYFASLGFIMPPAVVESSSINSVLQNIRYGNFLGCVSRAMLATPIAKGIVEVPGPGAVWYYPAGVAVRRQLFTPITTQRFVDAVVEAYQNAWEAPCPPREKVIEASL